MSDNEFEIISFEILRIEFDIMCIPLAFAAFQLIQNVPDIFRVNAFRFEPALVFSKLSEIKIYIIRAGWNIFGKLLLTNRNEMFIEISGNLWLSEIVSPL